MKLAVAFRELLPEAVVLELDRAYARIRGAWNSEHADDGGHTGITCDSITERGRTGAMGVWTDVPFNLANFTANGSMTWTPSAAGIGCYRYMLVGDTMFLDFDIFDSTVAGAVNTQLRLAVPGGAGIHGTRDAVFWLKDNGVGAFGLCQAVDSTEYLTLYADATATKNWTASAGLTRVAGQIHFKIQRELK